MIDIYKSLARPLLFAFDAERAHHFTLGALSFGDSIGLSRLVGAYCRVDEPRLSVKIGGMTLSNPIGLAAGLDKEGVALGGLASFGFGAIEVGTVTAEAQSGNPLPRIFRLPADFALINRMGFPSSGADALARQLRKSLPLTQNVKLGINIGKTKRIDIDRAAEDYLRAFESLREFGDYFVLNVSSPNTPELRKLQEPERLKVLISAIQSRGLNGRPLMIKIAPDLDSSQLNEIVDTARDARVDAIIATNTTFARDGLRTRIDETGGLSGAPLFTRARSLVAQIYRRTGGAIPIIGSGGIFKSDDVWSMMEAGASAVQLYTGIVYEGPLLVRRILCDLTTRISRENLPSITAIIGRKNGDFSAF